MPAVTTPDFFPDRLIEAVKSRGLAWKDLAEHAGIKTTTLSDYKCGHAMPSPDQLNKLARALEFPVTFFIRPARAGTQLVGPRLFRASLSITKRAADQAESRLALMSECLEYAEQYLQTPKPDFLAALPAIEDPFLLTMDQVEEIAATVRQKLGYGVSPVQSLVRTLERAGVAILRYESLSDVKMDGLSQHSAIGRPLCAIFARKQPSLAREYFSLAHELGHMVLHAHLNPTRFDDLSDEKILEGQANRFASAFLLPATTFRSAVAAPTLNYFEFLKREWKASIACMMYRCRDLGIIDQEEYVRLFVRRSQKRWNTREPLDDIVPIEQPVLLQKVFETLHQRHGISGPRIARDLARNPSDLAAISGTPAAFFVDTEAVSNVFLFTPQPAD